MTNIPRDPDEEPLSRLKKAPDDGDRPRLTRAQMRRLSDEWLRRLAGTKQSDSAELIREDRDR